jgi:hypothetical protein
MRSGEPLDVGEYERFLRDIGYVLPEGNDFTIRTTNVDDEIAVVAGPQLVVPLSNARRNHGLHLEIKIDRGGLVGRDDPAGIADIVLESCKALATLKLPIRR